MLLTQSSLPGKEVFGWRHIYRRFLGVCNGYNLYSAQLLGTMPDKTALFAWREALITLPAEQAAALTRAIELQRFMQATRFCGACATPLQQHDKDMGKSCPTCGQMYYPPVSPAMMVLIYDDSQRLLLARSPRFEPGMYSALAGFVEPGETLEECVHREVAEEVGVKVTDLQYIMSQSWPFPHSLMLAFSARYAGGEIVMQPGEIEDAGWFTLNQLPGLPPSVSVAHRLIYHVMQQLQSA